MSEPTWDDLYDVGKATLQSRRPALVVEQGDVSDAIIAGVATVGTAIVAYASAGLRATFLDGAFGDDLTALAHDRGVDRDNGSPARGYLTLTRISFINGAGVIPAGTRVATNPTALLSGAFATPVPVAFFTLDADAVFNATDLVVSPVSATCTVVGKIGNVADHTIVRFIDNIFDGLITPSNPEQFAAGAEAEDDPSLRDRVRGFFLTQARGTLDALAFGARQVPGVDRVSIEIDTAGIVTVFVADADGNSNTAMVDAVNAELLHWKDAADVVNATGGVVFIQAITIRVSVRTGASVAALLDRIRQAIIARVGLLNPGETLHPEIISAAGQEVDKQNITRVEVVSPSVSIVPTDNQLIRTDAGSIAITA